MYCAHCGEEIPDDSRFCRFCGEPIDSESAGARAAVKASDQVEAAVDKTVVKPATKPTPIPASRPVAASAPRPTAKRSLPVVPIAVAIAAALLLAVFVSPVGNSLLSGGSSDGAGASVSEQNGGEQDLNDDGVDVAGQDESGQDGTSQGGTVNEDTNGDSSSGSDNSSDSGTTAEQRAEVSCAFMMAYETAVHDAEEGQDIVPTWSPSEWAELCIPYVDPDSDLGQRLLYDPESEFVRAGHADAVTEAQSAEVIDDDPDGVTVRCTVKGTQYSWQHTIEFNTVYLITLNDKNQVTSASWLRTE